MLRTYSKLVRFNSLLLIFFILSIFSRQQLVRIFPVLRKYLVIEIWWATVIIGIIISFVALYLLGKSKIKGRFAKIMKWFVIVDILFIPVDIFYIWYRGKKALDFLEPHRSFIPLCILFLVLWFTHVCIGISLRRKLRVINNQN